MIAPSVSSVSSVRGPAETRTITQYRPGIYGALAHREARRAGRRAFWRVLLGLEPKPRPTVHINGRPHTNDYVSH